MFEGVDVADLLHAVRTADLDAEPFGTLRVDAIQALDRLVAAAQAEQLVQIAALHEAQSGPHLTTGDNALSVVGQVSLARTIGADAAGRQLAAAFALTTLPRTGELLRRGAVAEPVFRAVARETEALDPADLEVADAEIARRVVGLTARKAADLARSVVLEIDAEAARERAERARSDSYVSAYAERDGVAVLYARGPAEQITAAYEALDRHAVAQRAGGDARTRGQIMVQTLVERVTGLAHADQVAVELQIVMDAATVVGSDSRPAELVGHGPIAPDVADEVLARATSASVRRLLVDPVDGSLVARDPRRRRFDGPLGGFLSTRDRRCRRPGCDCRTRHLDHVTDHARGGPTTASGGQGLCVRSHTIKHLPGWSTTADGSAVVWRTPTGHEYRSSPPSQLSRSG